MTRFKHDQFAKDYLQELLTLVGTVEVSRELRAESRQADIYFRPASGQLEPQELGLLGHMASHPCVIEPFRNPASATQIRDCISKLFSLQQEFSRQAKRTQQKLTEADLPNLWILVPSASAPVRQSFGAIPNPAFPVGVYLFPQGYRTGLVVLNQLPKTQATLWLRLLSRGRTQQQALQELEALPLNHPLKENVEDVLSSWRTILEEKKSLTTPERELYMSLSATYLRRQQQWLEEGKQQGLQQGQRQIVENLLRTRFGQLDQQLQALVSSILALSPQEYAALLLQLSQLSREDLVARFPESSS